jgi:hypothetical protein
MERNRQLVTSCILLFTVLLVAAPLSQLSGFFATKEFHLSDEGMVVDAAERASHGRLPHLAFPYYYSGGLEIFLGCVFNLVGPSFAIARWVLACSMALTVVFAFLLSVSAGISIQTGFVSALAITISAYAVNYHIHPAWLATPPVLLGMLLLLSGVERGSVLRILFAGACFGIATSIKQNTGIYALAGSLLFATWAAAVRPASLSPMPPTESTRHRFPSTRLALALLMPVGVIIFFLIIIRTALTPLNLLMFCLVPCVIAGFSTYSFWKASLVSARERKFLVQYHERITILLISGFVLGFLPIAIYYAVAGGLHEFISEAFIKVHGLFTRQQSDWGFTPELTTSNPFTGARRLVLHLLPLFAIAVSFATSILRSKRHPLDSVTLTMFLSSAVLAALHFTLFPVLGAIYLLYLLPLIALPFVFHFEELLKPIFVKPLGRAIALLLLLVFLTTGYLSSRLAAGDWARQDLLAKRIARLNVERGGIYIPIKFVEYLTPILGYLEGRPPEESFLAFDRMCETIAFLTGRASPVDYSLKYYENPGLGEQDLSGIERIAEERKIDIIVIGKHYLPISHSEQGLFAYLQKNFTLVIDNPSHLIYQRITH